MFWPRSACLGSTLAQSCLGSAHACSGSALLHQSKEAATPPPHWTDEVRLSLSMPEPMLSLSMLILATMSYPSQDVLQCSEHRSARSERPECSEHFWTLGTLFGHNTAACEPSSHFDKRRRWEARNTQHDDLPNPLASNRRLHPVAAIDRLH